MDLLSFWQDDKRSMVPQPSTKQWPRSQRSKALCETSRVLKRGAYGTKALILIKLMAVSYQTSATWSATALSSPVSTGSSTNTCGGRVLSTRYRLKQTSAFDTLVAAAQFQNLVTICGRSLRKKKTLFPLQKSEDLRQLLRGNTSGWSSDSRN